MKKNIFLVFIFSLLTCSAYSQMPIDRIFKLMLFLESENPSFKDSERKDLAKSDSTLIYFLNENLIIDTLINESENIEVLKDYLFFSFKTQSDTTKDNIFSSKFYVSYWFNCKQFILAVNIKNNKAFRMGGFDQNDFFAFLRDVKIEVLKASQHINVTTKKILKSLHVDKINFDCIYYGLLDDKKINSIEYYRKYPCLINCTRNYGVADR
jgi:hypothetical protein